MTTTPETVSPFTFIVDDDGAVALYPRGQNGLDISPMLIMLYGDQFELTVCDPGSSREIASFGRSSDALDAAQTLLRKAIGSKHRLSVAVQRCA